MADGQTATNPQTGERVILQGGRWVPVGGSPAGVQPPVASVAPTSAAPRGVRNNNPGNVEDGAFARSLPGYAGSDGRFARFDSPEAGEQVAPRLLASYVQRGFDTPAEIINRWAPPSDNNPTAAYAQYVAQRAGLGVNDRVMEQHIPLIAQAIREFENGERPTGSPPASSARQTATNPQTGEKMELVDGVWTPAGGEASPQTVNGRPVIIENSDPVQTDATGAYDYDSLSPEMRLSLQKGDRVGLNTGQTVTLRGQPYVDTNLRETDRFEGGVNLREPNTRDAAQAAMGAFSEQIPFGDEAAALGAGMISGRGYSDVRDQQAFENRLLNQSDRSARVAGGVAGFAAGLAAPGGSFIANGPTALYRASRAAAVGGGLGALYGAGAADGGLKERLQGAAVGGGLGLATGGVLQGGIDAFAQGATRAAANPSAARRLSREGVTLTPGQMVQSAPVIGPMLRGIEDGASSIPFMGSAIQGARNQGTESFNRVAINRALSPIGETLPRGATGGYEAVQQAQTRLGAAYDEVLPRVSAQLDKPLYDNIASILERSAGEMPEPMVRQFGAILQNRVFRGVDEASATLDGQQFKRIESELGALAREYRTTNDPAARSLGRAIEDTQGALRDMLARQNPTEAARIRQINEGYANLTRVERAAGSAGALQNEGMFTPAQLGQASLAMGGSRSRGGAGEKLMQDLASAGKAVLPNTIGDSGTASRGAVTALIGGGAAGVVNPALAIPVVATSLAYSRPAQAALNAIYRATDRPGAVSEGLSQLASLARRNPALVPYFEGALLHSQLASPSEARSRTPASRGLFGARSPQMAPQ